MFIGNFKRIKNNKDGTVTFEYNYSNITKKDKLLLRRKYKCKYVTKKIINKLIYDALSSYIILQEEKRNG